MCGINLIVDKKKQLSELNIQQMNEATQHRGPDQTNFYKYEGESCQFFFGHNRLKIIDLSDSANQPFFSTDNRYILLFNGEIYNYKNLKRQLQAKYIFRTNSDTEVLLNYLIEKQFANNNLEELNGMFAFIFFDTYTQTLQIGKDKLNIKPLYYFEDTNYLIISSEIKGILASGLVAKKLNESQILHYLAFKYAKKPETFYENIFEIANSEWKFEITQQIKHAIPNPQFPIPNPQSLTSKIQDSIQRQVFADVPVGIFLSGGVDSSLLLALMQDLGFGKIPSFSIANIPKDRNFGTADYHFARLAAQKYGSEHCEVLIEDKALDNLEKFIARIDQPIGDSAYFLTDMLSEVASKQVKVVLSGAGADELFGGYNRHFAFAKYLKYQKALNFALPMLKNLDFLLPDGFAHPFRKQFRLIKKLLAQLDKSSTQTFINFTKIQIPILSRPTSQPSSLIRNLCEALVFDQENYLSSDILPLTDKASMQYGLEVRVPYLDNEIIAFARNIPEKMILAKGKKWLLKEILCQKGGEIFTNRPKEGFGMPVGQWLKMPRHQHWMQAILNPKNKIYDSIEISMVRKIIHQHQTSKQDFTSEIWALLVLVLWIEREF